MNFNALTWMLTLLAHLLYLGFYLLLCGRLFITTLVHFHNHLAAVFNQWWRLSGLRAICVSSFWCISDDRLNLQCTEVSAEATGEIQSVESSPPRGTPLRLQWSPPRLVDFDSFTSRCKGLVGWCLTALLAQIGYIVLWAYEIRCLRPETNTQ